MRSGRPCRAPDVPHRVTPPGRAGAPLVATALRAAIRVTTAVVSSEARAAATDDANGKDGEVEVTDHGTSEGEGREIQSARARLEAPYGAPERCAYDPAGGPYVRAGGVTRGGRRPPPDEPCTCHVCSTASEATVSRSSAELVGR